jgi:hypothetical protein
MHYCQCRRLTVATPALLALTESDAAACSACHLPQGVFNNASGSYIKLNSTVFHTLNTSASAPAYHGWSAQMPTDGDGGAPDIHPRERGKTLVIFHQGHDVPHNVCQTDNNGEVEWINTMGYDAMELEMPFLGTHGFADRLADFRILRVSFC